MLGYDAYFSFTEATMKAVADMHLAKARLEQSKRENERRAEATKAGPEVLACFEQSLAACRADREKREEKERRDALEERRVRALERIARAAERSAENSVYADRWMAYRAFL